MALFFDQEWFDAQLKARGASRADLAQPMRLTPSDIDDIWKDQRELRIADVMVMARFLGRDPAEVANRAGVSTPVPTAAASVDERLSEMNDRLVRIERALVELKALVLGLNR
jgi:hypothetical protein